MLDHAPRIRLFYEPRSDESPCVLAEGLLIALKFIHYLFEYDARPPGHKQQYLDSPMIRHPLEMPFQFFRTLYLLPPHINILSYTWVYESVLLWIMSLIVGYLSGGML